MCMINIFKKTHSSMDSHGSRSFSKGVGRWKRGVVVVEVNIIQIYICFFSFLLFLLSFDKGGANPITQRRCTVQVK